MSERKERRMEEVERKKSFNLSASFFEAAQSGNFSQWIRGVGRHDEWTHADELHVVLEFDAVPEDQQRWAVRSLKDYLEDRGRKNRKQRRFATVRGPQAIRYHRDYINAFASGVKFEATDEE